MQSYGLSLAFRRAEEKFREVLADTGRNPPVLHRIYSETDFYHNRINFCATFYEYQPLPPSGELPQVVNNMMRRVEWHIDRREMEEDTTLGRYGRAALCNDLRSLYSRMYEDHLMEEELRPRREIVNELTRRAAPPVIIAQAIDSLRMYEDHVRRNHSQPPRTVAWPTLQERHGWFVGDDRLRPLSAVTQREMQERMRRYEEVILGGRYCLNSYVWDFSSSVEVGSAAAQAKGLDLLKSWLTPEQSAQYEKTKSFEVVGSDTKKRYRIKHGRQMNIEEIDANGKRVRGLCALPSGSLVAADCMLGQKLALETNEKQFLAVANKFA